MSLIRQRSNGLPPAPFCALQQFSTCHFDKHHAGKVWAGLCVGEIALFDRADVDFRHLAKWTGRAVFWVTRGKDRHQFRVVKKNLPEPEAQ